MVHVCPDCLGEIDDALVDNCAHCGIVRPNAGWMPDPLTGLILGNRYRLESRLGAGGMATVFRASRIGALGGAVAVKLLAPRLARTVIAKRFEREAQVVSRLTNPYIVRIYDYDSFKLPGRDENLYYFAMEIVEGATLTAVIKKQGKVNFLWGIDILRQVARGLDEAHSQGVVHRDLKPSNIMLQQQRSVTHVKILDFGIAALAEGTGPGATHAGGEKLTQTGFISGTPDYMAPEQAVGEPHIGPPADIYALGLIAFEMFSGKRPFTGGNTMELLLARVTKSAPKLAEVAPPELPPDLYRIVDKMLETDPKKRYQSAGELLDDLGHYPTLQTSPDFVPPAELIRQYGTGVSQPAMAAAALDPTREATRGVSREGVAPDAPARARRGVPAWVWIVVVLVLGGVGTAVALVAGGSSKPSGGDETRIASPTPSPSPSPTPSPSPSPEPDVASPSPSPEPDVASPSPSPEPDVASPSPSPAPDVPSPTPEPPADVRLGAPRPPIEPSFTEVALTLGDHTLRVATPTTAPALFAPLPMRVALDRGADALRIRSGVLALSLQRTGDDAGRAEGKGREPDGRLEIDLPPRPLADIYEIVLSLTLADGSIVPVRLRYDANDGKLTTN
ncbi:MAG: protein kinase [Deltaproteobacteria bacterium]|nr:protein kinase [Deltaproteobacteria bacterium]